MIHAPALFAAFFLAGAASAQPADPVSTPAVTAGAPVAAPPLSTPPQAAEAPKPAGPRVALQTGLGRIVLELDREKAPITVANFLRYVDQKRFDGTSFYRALKFPAPTPLGLIQAGIKGRSDKTLPPIAHEPTSKTGLSHTDGAISMARGAPGSAQGDFFIIIGNLNTLDASETDPGYAVFGRVVEGMDVVIKLLGAPTSPTEGSAAMKGQMIAAPVPVVTATRIKG
ncbi:MAG: peptidylprolyl isomerase [Sphingomonas sp.]